MMRWWWLTVMVLLVGCSGVPKGLQPVSGFELERYLGRWHEIARLDHSFERGLTNVTAEYRLLPDGRVEVINRGFDPAKNAWRDAKGVARFQGAQDVGSLEVSFFGPFYGAYNVLVLDADYRYALVAGPNRSYLWILARDPQLDRGTLETLVARAKEWGFATDALIYVDQTPRELTGLGSAAGSNEAVEKLLGISNVAISGGAQNPSPATRGIHCLARALGLG